MRFRYGVAFAVTLLAAACGGPSSEPTPSDQPLASDTASATAPSTPTTPDGQRSLFIASLSTENVTIAPPYNMVVSEDVVVLGDGRVRAVADGEVGEVQLTQDELDAFVAELTEADLGRFVDVDPPGEVLMGAQTTTIRVDVGEPVEITAYALGEGYPEELVAVNQRLIALAEQARAEGERAPPQRVRLYVTPPFAGLVGPESAWPEALAVPDGIDTPDDAPPFQAEFEGADAAAIVEAFGGEEFAVWTVGTLQYQVAWVPLLL